jgi:hypothetical protein
MVIRHRKASLFYKTMNGAEVGDALMSLIHTAELNGKPAFPYLVALLTHHDELEDDPAAWLPWTYETTMARLAGKATE